MVLFGNTHTILILYDFSSSSINTGDFIFPVFIQCRFRHINLWLSIPYKILKMVWYFQLVIHPVSILRPFQFKFEDYTNHVHDCMSTVQFLRTLDTYGIYTGWISSHILHILGGIQYKTSTYAEASVAYAAPGDFAGEINLFICHENIIFCFSQIRGACGGGEGQFRCCCYR